MPELALPITRHSQDLHYGRCVVEVGPELARDIRDTFETLPRAVTVRPCR